MAEGEKQFNDYKLEDEMEKCQIIRLYLGVFAFSATHTAKLAAAAAPVLLVFIRRSFRRVKAKRMERFTAHLAKQHLQNHSITQTAVSFLPPTHLQ